jgi:hypothetical protein
MHPHEEAVVRAFIAPPRRARWLDALVSAKRRRAFLDRLNHCRDIDDRYAKPLPPGSDVVALLRSMGAPTDCHVVSDIADIDGRDLPLVEAVDRVELGGFGTIVSCLPGRLAYYSAESGSRRLLLWRERDASRVEAEPG